MCVYLDHLKTEHLRNERCKSYLHAAGKNGPNHIIFAHMRLILDLFLFFMTNIYIFFFQIGPRFFFITV